MGSIKPFLAKLVITCTTPLPYTLVPGSPLVTFNKPLTKLGLENAFASAYGPTKIPSAVNFGKGSSPPPPKKSRVRIDPAAENWLKAIKTFFVQESATFFILSYFTVSLKQ